MKTEENVNYQEKRTLLKRFDEVEKNDPFNDIEWISKFGFLPNSKMSEQLMRNDN
jgi:hypothetical protein